MGEPDVNAMLNRIPFWQFLEWMEFDRTNPIGPQRGDWQAAAICAAMMNGFAAQMRSKKRFRVKDFLLEFGDPKQVAQGKKKQSWQEQKFIARMFVAMSKPAPPKPAKKKRK